MLNDIPFAFPLPKGKVRMKITTKEFCSEGNLLEIKQSVSLKVGEIHLTYLKNKILNEPLLNYLGQPCSLEDDEVELFDYENFIGVFFDNELIASIDYEYEKIE